MNDTMTRFFDDMAKMFGVDPRCRDCGNRCTFVDPTDVCGLCWEMYSPAEQAVFLTRMGK